jgi:hypothetical protein
VTKKNDNESADLQKKLKSFDNPNATGTSIGLKQQKELPNL